MNGTPPDDVPRSPSGRVPQWAIDEAAGKPVDPAPFRGAPNLSLVWSKPSARRRRSGRVLRSAAAVVTGVVVVGGLAWGYTHEIISVPPLGLTAAGEGFPPPGVDEGDRPEDLPVVGPVGASTAFRFLKHQQDGATPVTWSPCRPIHWVVRPENGPTGGQALLEKAFARVSAATGIGFVADGVTTETWVEDREPYQPDRYGDRWAPVLVVWATSREVPDFGADVAGEAGPYGVRTPSGDTVFVSGGMALSEAEFRTPRTAAQRAEDEAIVLHELGHLMGLAHVDDRAQLMFPRVQTGRSDFGPGDLSGLTALGRGPCRPEI